MSKYIEVTETAKIIRKVLKEAFPGVKFSVRSDKYSGGATIYVRWTDGPTTDQVNEFTSFFEGSTFDGMRDMKEHTYRIVNGEEVHFCSDHIFIDRDASDDMMTQAVKTASGKYLGREITLDEYKEGARRTRFNGLQYEFWRYVDRECDKISLCETRPSQTFAQWAGAAA